MSNNHKKRVRSIVMENDSDDEIMLGLPIDVFRRRPAAKPMVNNTMDVDDVEMNEVSSSPPMHESPIVPDDLPAIDILPNDHYVTLAKYNMSGFPHVDYYNAFIEYMRIKGNVSKQWLVVRMDGVFSSYFTLVHLPSHKNDRLDILKTQRLGLAQRQAATPEQRKTMDKQLGAFDKMVKKFDEECLKLTSAFGGATAKQFEIIIPAFGCEALAALWPVFAHPFDASSVINDFAFKPTKHWLDIGKSGDPNHRYGVSSVNALFKTILVRDVLMVELNTSALYRMLTTANMPFDRLPCADYLKSHVRCRWYLSIDPSAECREQVIHNDRYAKQVRPKIEAVFATPERLASMDQAFQQHLKLDLYEYQKRAVTWMMQVEARQAPVDVIHTIYLDPSKQLVYDVYGDQLVPTIKTDTIKPQLLPYKGGILADEMGLGKTVTTLALMVANPPLISDEAIHHDTAVIRSRATLVVAPNHLVVPVWKTEFNKSCKSNTIVTITGKLDFERLKVKDLMHVDVVVVSAEFLEGNAHLHAKDARLDGASMGATASVYERTSLYCKQLAKTFRRMSPKDVEALPTVPMHMYQWHRLVVDEAHKLLDSPTLACMLQDFCTTSTWCLSGTPFLTTPATVERMCKLLGVYAHLDEPAKIPLPSAGNAVMLAHPQHQARCKHLFAMNTLTTLMPQYLMWRSTKQDKDVQAQISIPTMVDHIHVLDFTPTERMLYTRALIRKDMETMRQLCCQVKAEGGVAVDAAAPHKTLDEISALLIKSRQTQLTASQSMVKTDSARVQRKQEKLDRRMNDVENRMTALELDQKMATIDRLEAKVKGEKQRVDDLEREIAYFETALKIRDAVQMDETTKQNVVMGHTCPVCMDEPLATPALTSCGHLFCVSCIQQCKQTQGKCPVCRKSLTKPQDILPVAINDAIHRNAAALVNQYGTKMGNLICHLRQVWADAPEEKVIIFSSQNDDLQRLGQFLAREEIPTVYCHGNVAQRNKAFVQFNDPKGKVCVMLLSLEKNAAGSNLTVAAEIIMLDSIWDGTYAQQVASELQALNRAHRVGQTKRVRIVRLLIRDTIETERFKLHYPEFDQTQSLVVRDFELRSM